MKRYYVEDEDEIGTLYIGTAREMKSLYKNLKIRSSAMPLFIDDPIFVKDRMYGIYLQPDGFYVDVNANTCLMVLTERRVYE